MSSPGAVLLARTVRGLASSVREGEDQLMNGTLAGGR